ncbi:MAG: glycosyltransferase family 1 protein [Myxococcales bacterium]|nr:MAG: glycosyltransferase family 1 protein [Myxococcales bacterium]
MRINRQNEQADFDLICFSHLRWSFVFQRPQHLLSRCAKARRVFYVEEPLSSEGGAPRLDVTLDPATQVTVVVPHLPDGLSDQEREHVQARLISELCEEHGIDQPVGWFYTPMALPLAAGLQLRACVYDCMDELSAFRGAPPSLLVREAELMAVADVVFTGGHAIFEAKRDLHHNIHPFPSSVDTAHFGQARQASEEPADQASIPGPRLGFFGVIDERMDLALLEGVARARPDWQLVILGPVVKIDEADLPRLSNIHYLGGKSYAELPRYIAGWDVALLPFAKNESTRFISPTKTPEYLAAGKPVVSTSIRDVVRPYSALNLVRIADTPEAFVAACEAAIAEPTEQLISRADPFLAKTSWDLTWRQMDELVQRAVRDNMRSSGERFHISSPAQQREVG